MPGIRYYHNTIPQNPFATINGQMVISTTDERTGAVVFRVRDVASGRDRIFTMPRDMVESMPLGAALRHAVDILATGMPDRAYDQERDVDAQSGYRRHERERMPRWYEGQAGSAEGDVDWDNPDLAEVAHRTYNGRSHRGDLPFPIDEDGGRVRPFLAPKFDPVKELKKALGYAKTEKKKSVVRMIRFRVG